MEQDIRRAIRELLLLTVVYSGERRLIAPYTLGKMSSGRESLRCFQYEGGSVSGNEAGWKLMHIDKIDSVEVNLESFEIHEQYRMNDKVMVEIYEQVGL